MNTKDATVSLVVLDQTPVPEDERLKMTILAPKGLKNYESLCLRKKDSFIHPGSAKKFSSCNGFIEYCVNYFTDSCDKRDKTPDGLRHE